MTLAEMRQEVMDRGYKFINETRLTGFLQRAYQQICARELWPFLETTKEGNAPLEVADVRKVMSVRDVTNDVLLQGVSRNYLVHYYSDLTDTGKPSYWYLENNTIKVYPVSTIKLDVRYFKVPAELASEDEPLIPKRFQYLVIDRAIVDCLRNGNDYDEARGLMADYREGLGVMTADLIHRNLQDPRTILRTGSVDDYL